jgi:hypothetical protein
VLQRRGLTRAVTPPIQNFDGLSNADYLAVLGNTTPAPDSNGDIGPNHYVQMVNHLFAVYAKNGSRLFGPAANYTL